MSIRPARRALALLFCLLGAAGAQRPDTTPAASDVAALRVILRRNPANDVIAANLYLLGGTRQLTPETQGIEALLLAASERGTRRYPRDAVRQKTARLGSNITISPGEDWTVFGFTAIRSTFDSTWSIFADRLMAPTLDSAEVEFVRERMITDAERAESFPDPLVNHLADSLEFVGHPYGLSPEGTASSLRSIRLAALRQYARTQMVTSRMLLVVVGDVDRATLERLVRVTIATLPRGGYAWSSPPPPPALGRALVVRGAELPTNYLLGYYAGPPARDADYQSLRAAAAVLSGRLFTEVRSKRNLSYEVDAPFVERAIATGGIYVTTVDPNTTLQVMRAELNRLQTELIEREGLERLVQQFLTEYFLKNETNGDQANFLARAAIYRGDYRIANRFVDELRRVRPEDVRRVARQYMRDYRFVFLGNAEKVPRALLDQF